MIDDAVGSLVRSPMSVSVCLHNQIHRKLNYFSKYSCNSRLVFVKGSVPSKFTHSYRSSYNSCLPEFVYTLQQNAML